jgi:hypothetical protein
MILTAQLNRRCGRDFALEFADRERQRRAPPTGSG